jgi:hypothetical protein
VFRSVAPESSVGLIPATRFETFGLGLDHKFPTLTYVDIQGEWLQSRGTRTVGILTNSVFIPVPDSIGSTKQRIEFEEQTLAVSVGQLVGDHWSFSTRYRVSHADLDAVYPRVPPAVAREDRPNRDEQAILHQISLNTFYTLPCGFFAEGQAIWTAQENDGNVVALAGEDLWQFNVFAGYRFWRRHAEARLGVLNITDQDYKLNPLTLYNELPRERTFYASFKFYF